MYQLLDLKEGNDWVILIKKFILLKNVRKN